MIITFACYGQFRSNVHEIEVGIGSYQQHKTSINTFNQLNKLVNPEIVAEDFLDATWYSNKRLLRSFELAFGIRRFQSKDLRKELYLGVKVSGHFQRNTILIGKSETLLEETVIDKQEGRIRTNSSFKTTTFSEYNDFAVVGPMVKLRGLINDRFSINSSTSIGGLVPIKYGIQEAFYTGNITRMYVGENLESENREYHGLLEFDWSKRKQTIQARLESSVSIEFKPLDKKPYYFGLGFLLGTQLSQNAESSANYYGLRFSIHSQF